MSEQSDRRFVQVIDLWTDHPAELERVLTHWRATSLRGEHIAGADVGRDEREAGHLVLKVEYEPSVSPEEATECSPDAAAVVALLDRPPRFRPADG